MKAQLKDGVLKVSVPVPEARKKHRQIPIEEVTEASPAAMLNNSRTPILVSKPLPTK